LLDHTKLDAVDDTARSLGLREGLSLVEAHAFLAALEVRTVSPEQVRLALQSVGEAALAFAPTVELCPPDAVHLDLTGAAHLHGGELPLIEALRARVSELGHVCRVAVAVGPRIAEIVARHGTECLRVVEPDQEIPSLRPLPVSALPIDEATACWLVRVGILTIGDLLRLPDNQLTARLGDRAAQVMRLAKGQDPTPLQPWSPPPVLCEETSWDEGVEDLSSLVFVLNRLCTRLATRLQGRGQALRAMSVTLLHDRAIAQLRGSDQTSTTQLQMPAPLNRAEDLLRTLRARLEHLALHAPVLGIRLEATLLVHAPRIQLDLSRDVTASPNALPVLLAELAAEIGPDRIGTLCLVSTHRPEASSALRPLPLSSQPSLPPSFPTDITRLLPTPIALGQQPLCPGRLLLIDHLPPMEVQQVHFDTRLDDVEWWTSTPFSRDYFRVWMNGGGAGASAWVYRDRHRGTLLLHGWSD
jgi:protein ImuB